MSRTFVTYRCPQTSCGHEFSVDGSPESVHCPVCGAEVPAGPASGEPATPALLQFACPGCGARLNVRASAAGSSLKCPRCAQSVVVPAVSQPTASPTAAAPATTEPTVKFICGHCGRKIRAPASRVGRQAKCPGCQNTVVVRADAQDATAPGADTSGDLSHHTPPPLPPMPTDDDAARRARAEVLAAEEAARIEAERRRADEAARLEAERQRAERVAQAEAERKRAEEVAQLEAARRAAEEAAQAAAVEAAMQAEQAARRAALQKAKEAKEAEERARRQAAEEKVRREAEAAARKAASAEAVEAAVVDPEAQGLDPREQDRILAMVQAGEVAASRLGMSPARFFDQPLGESVLDHQVGADIYGVNPFRRLAVPAAVDHAGLNTATSRLRNIARLRPDAARQMALRTGYDGHLTSVDGLEGIDSIADPRWRILCEIFWPHMPATEFEALRKHGSLASRETLAMLHDAAKHSRGREHVLARHALAVACHNLALAWELSYATGHFQGKLGYWSRAVRIWNEVYESEEFWAYLRERVEAYDDPRLRVADVETLRQRLPGLILGFNRLLARAYARHGDNAACARHLMVIAKSGFPATARNEALISAVQLLVSNRLEPLILKAETPDEAAEQGKAERIPRRRFAQIYEPLVAESLRIRDYLLHDMHCSAELVATARFDHFCDLVVKGINDRIDYSDDARLRSILYGIQMARQLLTLPISESQQRQIERNIRHDTEILYKDMGELPEGFQAGHCWFIHGEPADPDASIELPVYKITEINAVNCRWNTRKVLVPRSALAAAIHRGDRKARETLANRSTDPVAVRLRGQIAELERQAAVEAQPIEARRVQRRTEAESRHARISEAYERSIGPSEQNARAAVARYDADLRARVAAEQKKCDDACAAVNARHAPVIDKARAEFEENSATFRGPAGFVRFELGGTGIALPIMLILTYMGLRGFGASTPVMLVLALIAAAAVGGTVGGLIRRLFVQRLGAPLERLSASRDAELVPLRAAAKTSIEEVRRKNLAASEGYRQTVAQIEAKRKDLADERKREIDGIDAEAAEATRVAQQTTSRQLAALQTELTGRTAATPESASREFPPYKYCKANGYSDGSEPSDAEAKRMMEREAQRFFDNLSYGERETLAYVKNVVSDEQFNQILTQLATASYSERRDLFSKLEALAMLGRIR